MTLPLQTTKEQWRQQRRPTQANRRTVHTSSHQDATDATDDAKDTHLGSTLTGSQGPENMVTDQSNPNTDESKTQHDIDGTRSKNKDGNTDPENNANGPSQETKHNG
jgi:hypothetical protein